MEIIRGRLSAADFSNPTLRYNPDTDTVEYSPDGGTTWNPDPADDPRVGLKFLKPLKTGSDVKCRSAASTVKWLRNFIEYETSIMTLGAGVTAIGNAFLTLLSPIAPYAVLIAILFEGADTLFTIGATALTTAFDEETWAALLCIVYCGIAANGSVTDAQFEDIQAAITSELNTTARIVLNLILQTQGRVGFQNSGTLYEVEDADCSDCACEWCHAEDLLLTDGGYDAFFYASVWTLGEGWRQGDDPSHATEGSAISLIFTAANLTKASFTYDATLGSSPGNATVFLFLSGVQVQREDVAAANGTNTWQWEGDATMADQVVFAVQASGAGALNGLASIIYTELHGIETSPFGEDNC